MKKQDYEIHFAPLQGFTDHIFRNAFDKYFGGVDVYYTPFVRIERGGFRNRDLRDIQPERNQVVCIVPQILPGSSEEFHLLAEEIKKRGYRRIDINLGCPFPLIAGKRKGAGMLPFPEQVREVLSTMEEYPELQFSLKMRLGWENVEECLLLGDILNNLPLCHITVHARTGKQQYKGEVDIEAFAGFYEVIKHPLIYNGDLISRQNIEDVLKKFPDLKGIAIGRGLLASPVLAKEFKEKISFSFMEQTSLSFSFHEELFATYSEILQGETQLLTKMKTLWEYFLPQTDRKLLKRIKKANKLVDYREAIKAIFVF